MLAVLHTVNQNAWNHRTLTMDPCGNPITQTPGAVEDRNFEKAPLQTTCAAGGRSTTRSEAQVCGQAPPGKGHFCGYQHSQGAQENTPVLSSLWKRRRQETTWAFLWKLHSLPNTHHLFKSLFLPVGTGQRKGRRPRDVRWDIPGRRSAVGFVRVRWDGLSGPLPPPYPTRGFLARLT